MSDALTRMLADFSAEESEVARGKHYHWTDEPWRDDGEMWRRPARPCWSTACPEFAERRGAVTDHPSGEAWWRQEEVR